LDYEPRPIDTAGVALTPDVLELIERLAEHNHDVWARQRIADGWAYGPQRDDARKRHPCLVPYDRLPDAEKQYDRNAAVETLKAILALGYRVVRDGAPPGPAR
jgi:ryanodine receptor 2